MKSHGLMLGNGHHRLSQAQSRLQAIYNSKCLGYFTRSLAIHYGDRTIIKSSPNFGLITGMPIWNQEPRLGGPGMR